MSKFSRLATTAVLALLATGALADNVGLFVGNGDYDTLSDIDDAELTARRASELRDFGFDLTVARDLDSSNGRTTLLGFVEATDRADRILVALSGRYVTDGARNWMLYADSGEPRLFDLDRQGISIESMLHLMSERPGQSVLLLGVDPDQRGEAGPFLSNGIAGLEVPENVTVLTGSPQAVARFIEDGLVNRSGDLIEAYRDSRGLQILGYAPRRLDFIPGTASTSPAERDYWAAAANRDTVEAYRAYLQRYPDGLYVEQARAALETLLSDPDREARVAEERLNLSRDSRRVIQRHLTVLGYNTRGVDGIFGGGTRRAIANWQQQNGFAQTSYLTADQITVLGDQATARASELDREAEREAERQRAAEESYWAETGARGNIEGLRAYLERYPEGRFAEEATRRLARLLTQERDGQETAIRTAWQETLERNTERAYREFMLRYPDSRYDAEARERIEELRRQRAASEAASNQGQQAEAALGLNGVTRRLIESRLAQLGLEPGAVDGQFDENSRAALRRYQRDRGLTPTGYMDEGTLIRLLADSFGELR